MDDVISTGGSLHALETLLSQYTGQPLDVITRDTERDNYMTAQQAKEYGLIDDILYKH